MSTSLYLMETGHPDRILDASAVDSCNARSINDPLDAEKENVESILNVRAPPHQNEITIVAIKDIVPGGELYMAYEGKYFADPDHPLELRRLAAIRYPTWAPYILNAAGKGDCQHPDCIIRRRCHINARIDPLDNGKDPDTSIIDLRCCQPAPHSSTTSTTSNTHTPHYQPSPYDVPLPPTKGREPVIIAAE